MIKKFTFLSAIAFVASGIASADPAPYLGASLGIINNTNTVTANGSNFTGGAYRGMPVGMAFGYSSYFGQSLYLAGEAFVTVATGNISANTQLKTSYGYGASVLPGFIVDERAMIFVRLGAVESNFTNNNDWRLGGELGLGSQIALTQQLDVRGEYDFVAYGAKQQVEGPASASVAPRSDQFNLGLIYKFE